MRTNPELTRLVCAPHCRFYRAGEKLEESCRGYDFLAERVFRESARAARTALESLESRPAPAKPIAHDPILEARLCATCDYRAEDCDFMSPKPPEGAVPCGGYVALARLLAECPDTVREWLDDE